MKNQGQHKSDGTLYAINKTAGKAFRRAAGSEEWEPVDPKSVSGSEMERVNHEKIGNNWFSVYKGGEGEK